MSKEEKIAETIIDGGYDGELYYEDTLKAECEKRGANFEKVMEVLREEDFLSCDRCGAIHYFDEFLYLDTYNFQDEEDKALLKAIKGHEGEYWGKICWDCVDVLTKEGERK